MFVMTGVLQLVVRPAVRGQFASRRREYVGSAARCVQQTRAGGFVSDTSRRGASNFHVAANSPQKESKLSVMGQNMW